MAEVYKATLQINGIKYPITTTEPEDYVEELGREIDRAVCSIIDQSHVSLNEALVLCCLNYLDAYRKSEGVTDHFRNQIAEYLEEASKARAQAMDARKELARLEHYIAKEGNS